VNDIGQIRNDFGVVRFGGRLDEESRPEFIQPAFFSFS